MSLDLRTLAAIGVRVVGRAAGIAGGRVLPRDELAETTAAAQRMLERLLARIGPVADAEGAPDEAPPPLLVPFAPSPPALDLAGDGTRTVLWATGFRRDHAWLQLPVLDATAAASRPRRGSMCSACASGAGGTRTSSMASAPMPKCSPSIAAAGTPPIGRTTLHYGAEAIPVDLRSGDGVDALYAPRRTLLDSVLVDAA